MNLAEQRTRPVLFPWSALLPDRLLAGECLEKLTVHWRPAGSQGPFQKEWPNGQYGGSGVQLPDGVYAQRLDLPADLRAFECWIEVETNYRVNLAGGSEEDPVCVEFVSDASGASRLVVASPKTLEVERALDVTIQVLEELGVLEIPVEAETAGAQPDAEPPAVVLEPVGNEEIDDLSIAGDEFDLLAPPRSRHHSLRKP